MRFVVAEVALAEVAGQREALRPHFTDREIEELASRHLRTMAGFLALKEAVCGVLRAHDAWRGISSRDIEIGHDVGGAPRLRSIAPSTAGPVLPGALSISISHSRDRAYGLAVLDEGVPDGGDITDPRA